MENITLYLPWPPTVNNYYAHTRNGVFISKKGRQYSNKIATELEEQANGINLYDPVFMEVKMFPPDRRRRDLDNHMKALQDSLVKNGLLEDDSLIDQLFIYRGEMVKGGLVIIEINDSGPVLSNPLALENAIRLSDQTL